MTLLGILFHMELHADETFFSALLFMFLLGGRMFRFLSSFSFCSLSRRFFFHHIKFFVMIYKRDI